MSIFVIVYFTTFLLKMAASIEQDWSKINYKIHPNIALTLTTLKFNKPTPVQAWL